jgi:hypothetical protein
MKRRWIAAGLAATLLVMPLPVLAAGTAQVRVSNKSVRMFPGDCSCGFGLIWTISFSSFYTEYPSQANGELAFSPTPGSRSHWSYLVLEDPSLTAGTTYVELDLPLAADADGNGTPDFLEVARPVATTSSGTYAVIWGPGYGALTLHWTRSAGDRQGSCQLYMLDPVLGEMGPFNHTFELIEQAGTFSYNVSSTHVTGTIRVAKTGDPSELLEGPVVLTRSPTNRFNLLTLAGGGWTNQVEVFTFADCLLTRDSAHPAAYSGTLANPHGSYRFWHLAIVDTNDANKNGIPDLSDDTAVHPPRRPLLSLARTSTQLRLRLSGEVGRTHLVQEAAAPNAVTWTTVQGITLTNDPQEIVLPLPNHSPAFWRVLVP